MPATDQTVTRTLELSRAEQWVVHHVVLDALRLLDQETPRETEDEDVIPIGRVVLEKLEAKTDEFTPRELALIYRTCQNHAKLTEEASDRNLASAITTRIETKLVDSEDEGALRMSR